MWGRCNVTKIEVTRQCKGRAANTITDRKKRLRSPVEATQTFLFREKPWWTRSGPKDFWSLDVLALASEANTRNVDLWSANFARCTAISLFCALVSSHEGWWHFSSYETSKRLKAYRFRQLQSSPVPSATSRVELTIYVAIERAIKLTTSSQMAAPSI
jgi:predicted RecB family nuclease